MSLRFDTDLFKITHFILGRVIHDIQTLVNTYPSGWLDRVSFWRSLHSDASACQECPDSPKRKLEEEERNLQNKRQKREQMSVSAERQTENEQGDETLANSKDSDFSGDKWFLEKTDECSQDKSVERNSFSFRVSCRCRGALAKSFTAQVCLEVIFLSSRRIRGIKKMKLQCLVFQLLLCIHNHPNCARKGALFCSIHNQ